MIKWILLSLLLFWGFPCLLTAQNMLINGDHEDYIPTPSIPDPSNSCFRELYPDGFSPGPNQPLNPPGIASASATPDHLCVLPRTGKAHGGYFHVAGSKYENPIYQLCQPLIPGESYQVSAWIALSPSSGLASDQIGFWFDQWGFYEPAGGIMNTPDYRTPPGVFFTSDTYTQIAFTFNAQVATDALIIGNFLSPDLPNGSSTIPSPKGGDAFAYYFLDDIAVAPIPRLVIPDTLCALEPALLYIANWPDCAGGPPAAWAINTQDTSFTMVGDSIYLEVHQTPTITVQLPDTQFIFQLPVKSVSVPDTWVSEHFLCPGDTLVLDAHFQGQATDHQWQSGEMLPSIAVTAPGNYSVQFNIDGCPIFRETEVTPLLTNWTAPELLDTVTICHGEILSFSPIIPAPFQWLSPDGELVDTLFIDQPGIYRIRVSPEPCEGEWYHDLVVLDKASSLKEALLIPNVFTPNGDGTNDSFVIHGLESDAAFTMAVFNRWGKEVFRTNDPSKGWDGTWKNTDQPSEVYAYLLEVSAIVCGERQMLSLKGDIMLIR